MAKCMHVPEDGKPSLSNQISYRLLEPSELRLIYAPNLEAENQATGAALQNNGTYHQGAQDHEDQHRPLGYSLY